MAYWNRLSPPTAVLLVYTLTISLFQSEVRAEQRSLLELKRRGFSIFYSKDGGGEVAIQAPGLAVSKVFELSNPSRIVVDLKGFSINKNLTTSVSGAGPFTAVRTGQHPDKVRVVLDFSGSTPPPFFWEQSKNKIQLKLSGRSPVKRQTASTALDPEKLKTLPTAATLDSALKAPAILSARRIMPEAAVRPEKAIIPELTKAPEIKAAMNSNAAPSKTTPTNTGEPLTTAALRSEDSAATPKPKAKTQQLNSITFAYQGKDKTPCIKFVLAKRAQFNLTKKSADKYFLKIPKTALGEQYLGLPQFPPQDFLGFSLVKAEQVGKDLEILIGVERGSRLTAVPKSNEIWVRLMNQ